MARADVIIPARDEAERIAETVEAALGIPGVEEVLVVDDGSRDDTAELARGAGARVIGRVRGRGKGAALEAGLIALDAAKATGHEPADAVLFLDADLGDAAGQAAALLGPVLAGDADMTVAAFPRPPGRPGGFGLVKGLARAGIHAMGSSSFPAAAPLSGQRALSRAALRVVRPMAPGYGAEVALTVRALRAGLRVAEIPTTMRHRDTGRDLAGFAHRGRQFVDVALALARLAFEPRRARMEQETVAR